eukprot:TRINITY_DN5423_c0_g2_i4.p2 TRINITY_DN5423_c0_g2~~TRINITY_DN5423_c0_g2_i4.p2  ORF type:complete len:389 (+),score=44.04 TRINITY_DN5423_c0_g2_i4:1485-2651(+)
MAPWNHEDCDASTWPTGFVHSTCNEVFVYTEGNCSASTIQQPLLSLVLTIGGMTTIEFTSSIKLVLASVLASAAGSTVNTSQVSVTAVQVASARRSDLQVSTKPMSLPGLPSFVPLALADGVEVLSSARVTRRSSGVDVSVDIADVSLSSWTTVVSNINTNAADATSSGLVQSFITAASTAIAPSSASVISSTYYEGYDEVVVPAGSGSSANDDDDEASVSLLLVIGLLACCALVCMCAIGVCFYCKNMKNYQDRLSREDHRAVLEMTTRGPMRDPDAPPNYLVHNAGADGTPAYEEPPQYGNTADATGVPVLETVDANPVNNQRGSLYSSDMVPMLDPPVPGYMLDSEPNEPDMINNSAPVTMGISVVVPKDDVEDFEIPNKTDEGV